MVRPVVVLVAVVLVALAVPPAPPCQADSAIVVEVYEGRRPADAERLIGPVMQGLRASGALAGVGLVGADYEASQSRPGVAVDQAALDGLPELVNRGFEAWSEARFAAATSMLGRAVASAEQASAALIMDGDLRGAYRKALVGLALAHKRLGHQREATAAMAELVRSFPDSPIRQLEFGPEAFRLYRGVQSSLTELGTGSLSVGVDDPDAIVFVNEQYAATPDRVKNLVPGIYRVLVRKGKTTGRVYRASVQAGTTAAIAVRWSFDQVLHTSPEWTGLVFPNASSRRRLLGRYAVQFARVVGASTVITVGIGDEESRRSVVGKVFNVDNAGPGRTASVAIEPVEPSPSHLRALGAYLAGATNVAPPRDAAARAVFTRAAESADRADPPSSGRGRRLLLWSALGSGAVAIGLGSYLLAIDGRGTCSADRGQACPETFHTATFGKVSIGVGAATVGVAAYLLWRGRTKDSARAPGWSLSIGPVNGIAWSGTF